MKVLTLHIILPHFSIKKTDESKSLNTSFPSDDFFFFYKVVNQINSMI